MNMRSKRADNRSAAHRDGFQLEELAPRPKTLIGVKESDRNGLSVSAKSHYSDDIWDFCKENPDIPRRFAVINFSTIFFDFDANITMAGYEHYLRIVKEFYYSLFVNPPHTYPGISSICRSVQKGLKAIIYFMYKSGIESFSDLTQTDMEVFVMSIAVEPNKSGGPITDRTLRSRVFGLLWLYEQSEKITDGIRVRPFGDDGTITSWCKSNALKISDRKVFTTPEMPDEVAVKLIQQALIDIELIDKIEEVRKSIELHRYIGRKEVINTCYGRVISDTRKFPWSRHGLSSYSDLLLLESRLNTAGYILIAMLTGMRFHEIQRIPKEHCQNWVEQKVDLQGAARSFYFVVSTTSKMEPVPTRYQWQTVPFVKYVLEAVERCNSRESSKASPWLFNTRRVNSLSISSINHMLKRYVQLHKIKFNDLPWELASHQFRKKHARIMIRQGLGIMMLKDQLKHYDVEMTKGYGDLNLYAELQQEKFELSSEKYAELIGSQMPVVGGGAEVLAEMRKTFSGMIASDRDDFLRSLSKKALIEQMDDGLCMYRPAKAMCGGDRKNCRPADCNNSLIPAVSLRRILKWRFDENKRLMRYFHGDSQKIAYLHSRVEEISKLLIQIDNVAGS